MTSPASLPVHTLAADIAARRLSPVDLVDEYLTRIERLEPRLHAFVSVNAANARLAAEAADKAIRSGHAVGPLHGIPIAIKDLVEIEGEVAMGGTAAWRNRIAPHTATLMRKLMAAGHDQPRQDPHRRVRLWRLGHQPASRHAVEPVGCEHASHAGRLVLRLRRRGRRAHGTLGDRHRHRRVGADPGGVERHHRPEDHDRPDQHVRRAAAQPDPGHARADHARRRGRGAPADRAAGRRSARQADAGRPRRRPDAEPAPRREGTAPRPAARRRTRRDRCRGPGRLRPVRRLRWRAWARRSSMSHSPRGSPISARSTDGSCRPRLTRRCRISSTTTPSSWTRMCGRACAPERRSHRRTISPRWPSGSG